MNDHATQWLGAYLDGELRGLRLRWVESHVGKCSVCQGELEALVQLKGLLRESPATEVITPPERFVAQVGLRLPRRQEQPPAQKAFELGWRLLPAGLLCALVFVQAVFTLAGVVHGALWLGFGGEVGAFLFSTQTGGAWLPDVSRLLEASLLDAVGIVWGLVQGVGALALLPVLYLCLLAVIGVLYWSWLASWWARRRHRRLASPEDMI